MASGIRKPTDVGFADFTAQLMTETFEAVVRSQLFQEREILAMERLAGMEVGEYAASFIDDTVLRDEILRLFPSAAEGASAIDPGSPYSPPSAGSPETPAVLALTGYKVGEGDVEKDPESGSLVITEAGYSRIAGYMRLFIAERHLEAVRIQIRRGAPRVLVDHGSVRTRLSFSLVEEKEHGAKKAAAISGIAVSPRFPILRVRPVSAHTPEVLGLRVDVLGEVEITFKTVTT